MLYVKIHTQQKLIYRTEWKLFCKIYRLILTTNHLMKKEGITIDI